MKPGKLTALMGASGAGKTTLLNTLAQRTNFGVVTGDFLVDGRPLPSSFQRSTGFAEQMDVHEETSTVREALRFSARLRQPREVPLEEKYAYVEKIIDLLEMGDMAGAAIGVPGSGLNQEQRKRVTIGVELASKPALLMFLDEPTSGLDSGAAFTIVRFLRKLADAGQAILCTIHQPSSVLFEHFDHLLLLQSGGRTVYFGELGRDSRTLLDYLERNGAETCPPQENPAEYMLEAMGAGDPNYKGKNWGDVWEASPENEQLSKEIREIVETRRGAAKEQTRDEREYAMPVATQMYAVIRRSFVAMWRDPPYVVGMFTLHIFTGLFNSFTFWVRFCHPFLPPHERRDEDELLLTRASASGQQPGRHAVTPLLRLHDAHHLAAAHPAAAAALPAPALPLRVARGQLENLRMAGLRVGRHPQRDSLPRPRGHRLLGLLVLGDVVPARHAHGGQHMAFRRRLRAVLPRLRAGHRGLLAQRAARVTPRAPLLHLHRLLLRRRGPVRRAAGLLAVLDVLAHALPLPARGLSRATRARPTHRMRARRARTLPAPARPRLPDVRRRRRPARRRIRPDAAWWGVRVLPVRDGRRFRGKLQRLPAPHLARLRHRVGVRPVQLRRRLRVHVAVSGRRAQDDGQATSQGEEGGEGGEEAAGGRRGVESRRGGEGGGNTTTTIDTTRHDRLAS